MKSPTNRKRAIAGAGARILLSIVVSRRAFHYAHAAKHDEHTGFPYTAAIEWRKAAELLDPRTLAAEYCWRQWERIMQLPRRLAGPIGVPPMVA